MAASTGVFPERPIRPLPKRRLRSRLSGEQAESIVYPPAPSSSSPLFGSPSTQDPVQPYTNDLHLPLTDSHNLNRMPPVSGYHSELDSDDEHEENTSGRPPYPHGFVPPAKSRPNHSAASSGDGYESFENTNNKKKRKIPQNHLSGGMIDDLDVGVAASTVAYTLDGSSSPEVAFANSTGSGSGVGLSGPGRGRHGRSIMPTKKERQSLGVASGAGRLTSPDHARVGQGVIGSAVADAKASQTTVRKGQAPLKQQSPAPQPYPFSFERDSQSSNKLKEAPRPPMAHPVSHPSAVGRDVTTHGTQTGVAAPGAHDPRAAPANLQQGRAPAQGQAEQPPPPSKTQQYKMAAQERRRSQLGLNARYLHQREAVTLCEFCEFKAIWHYTPRFLIRRYEEKDLKRRQDIENRRRLLEKAKAKGRKTKKGSKGNKNASQQPPADQDQPYDPAYEDELEPGDAQSPGEEYFDDPEYDYKGANGDGYDGYDHYAPALDEDTGQEQPPLRPGAPRERAL